MSAASSENPDVVLVGAGIMSSTLDVTASSSMTLRARADLVLAFSKTLYVNGQATEQTVNATERLGHALGLRATIMPGWGELEIVADGENDTLAITATAAPTGIQMERVASAMQAIDDLSLIHISEPTRP